MLYQISDSKDKQKVIRNLGVKMELFPYPQTRRQLSLCPWLDLNNIHVDVSLKNYWPEDFWEVLFNAIFRIANKIC